MSSTAAITSVVVAAAQAVGKVYLIGLVGFASTQFPKEKPLLPIAAVPVVARFSFHCLVLSLVFSTTAKSVNIDTIGNYWSLIVGALCVIAISYLSAAVLSWILLRNVKADVDALRIAATFPNIVALPILIFPSLCEFDVVSQGYANTSIISTSSLKDQCIDESNTMIFCYFFSWSLAFWTFGYPKLVASAERKLEEEDPTDEDSQNEEEGPSKDAETGGDFSNFIETVQSSISNAGLASVWSFGYPNISAETNRHPGRNATGSTRLRKTPRSKGPTFLSALKITMTSPGFLALLSGMIAGCIPGLPALLFQPGGALRWVGDALETLGGASSPLSTMIVAASLVPKVRITHEMSYRERLKVMFFTRDPNEQDTSSNRTVLVWFTLARLIVSPAVVVTIIFFTKCYFGAYVPPLAQLVIILNSCLPGALIIVVVLKSRPELHETATSVAKVYLPSYMLSIITIAAWTAFGLWVTLPDEDGILSGCAS